MKVTIEENEYSKYIFDTDEYPFGQFKECVERYCNAMIYEFEHILRCNQDDIVTTIEFKGIP